MDPMTELLEAMENWAEARDEYRKARDLYTGYCDLREEREWLSDATEALKTAFNEAVKAAIREGL